MTAELAWSDVFKPLLLDHGTLLQYLLLLEREYFPTINLCSVREGTFAEALHRRTLKSPIDEGNMALGQLAQTCREVDKRGALSGVCATEANHRHLRKPTCICFENRIDESGSADADGRHVRRGQSGDLEDLAHRVLYAGGDIGRRRGLVVCEHATRRFVYTSDIDQHTIGVCPWNGEVWLVRRMEDANTALMFV